MAYADGKREREGLRMKRGKTHSIYKVQMAFTGETVLSWSTGHTLILPVFNSMNKAVVIKIVEICCCSLQKEGWLLSFGLRFSLRLESLTEHKGKAVKTRERV